MLRADRCRTHNIKTNFSSQLISWSRHIFVWISEYLRFCEYALYSCLLLVSLKIEMGQRATLKMAFTMSPFLVGGGWRIYNNRVYKKAMICWREENMRDFVIIRIVIGRRKKKKDNRTFNNWPAEIIFSLICLV